MAWEEPSSSLFTMFKLQRPLIAIERIPARTTHLDPLRTPEDVPQHAPLYAAHVDHLFTPFEHAHVATSFPDVADTDWAMGILSPPSPSRRNSLELEPFPEQQYDDMDMDEDPPMLSPPSPSRRSLAHLPDADQVGSTFEDVGCPQLSPPSPINRSTALPSLELELDTTQGLFIEHHAHPHSPLPLNDTHSLFLDDPSTPPTSRLRAEYRALLSLRDRTVHAEHTSRARTVALRGRERELGRAVAKLRDGYLDSHGTTHTSVSESLPSSVYSVVSPSNSASKTPDVSISSHNDASNTPTSSTNACSNSPHPLSTLSLSSIPPTLQTYRTLATRVMLERTDEKRRRKKDKQRLKELRVVLGVGIEALLGVEGPGCGADVGLNTTSCNAETLASDGPDLGLEESSDGGVGLGITYSPPAALHVAPLECEGGRPPDSHLDSNQGLGLAWMCSSTPTFGGLDDALAFCSSEASDPPSLGLSLRMPPDAQGTISIPLNPGLSPDASPKLPSAPASSFSPDMQSSLINSSLDLGLGLPYEKLSNLGLDLGLAVHYPASVDRGKEHAFADHIQGRGFAFAHVSSSSPSSPISVACGLSERTHAMRRLVARMTLRRRDLGMRSLIEAGNMSGSEGARLAGGVRDARPHGGMGRSRLSTIVFVADGEGEKCTEEQDGDECHCWMVGSAMSGAWGVVV